MEDEKMEDKKMEDKKMEDEKMKEMEKVGFFPRLVAYIIDDIIVLVGIVIVSAIFGLSGYATGQVTTEAAFGVLNGIGLIIALVWTFGYFIFFWSTRGQTPGKMIMGIKIVSTDGGPVTVGKAILRLIGYAVSGIVIYLGFLWVIWDKDKQGWHDKIARTYVVKA